jgi:hypothetical protein
MNQLHQNPKRKYGDVCEKHPELKGERYVLHNRCVGCNRDASKRKTELSPENRREYADRSRRKTKLEVFNHYGGMHCAICGFNHEDALCLDHIDGGGGGLRKSQVHPWGGYALYVWLRKYGYPKAFKFRVLCFNCNAIQSVNRLRAERKERKKC